MSRGKASNADRQQFLSALRVHPTKIHSIYLTRADSSKKAEKKRVKSKPQNGAPVIVARRPVLVINEKQQVGASRGNP